MKWKFSFHKHFKYVCIESTLIANEPFGMLLFPVLFAPPGKIPEIVYCLAILEIIANHRFMSQFSINTNWNYFVQHVS